LMGGNYSRSGRPSRAVDGGWMAAGSSPARS
jgi:hypothetical protein